MTPEQYAQNLLDLQDNHPWMDTNTHATLALQYNPLPLANQMKQATASTWNGYAPLHPTGWRNPGNTQQFLSRHLSAIGANSINTSDLLDFQRELQAHGHGQGLDPSGRWDSNWQQALHARTEEVYEQHKAGDHAGSVSSRGLLGSVIHTISPSGIMSSLWGTIKSLPADVIQLASDDVAAAGAGFGAVGRALHGDFDLGKTVQQYGDISHEMQAKLGQDWVMEHTGLGGLGQRDEDFTIRDALAANVNDIGTVLLFAPGVGALGAAGKGTASAFRAARAGEGMWVRDATSQAAVRGSTTYTARTLRSQAGKRIASNTAVGAGIGGTQAAIRGEDITTGAAQGAALGLTAGVVLGPKVRSKIHLPDKAYSSIPVLRSTVPKIDAGLGKLVGTEANPGAWYRMRTKAATPYQYGAVRFAGSALTEGQKYSLKVAGISWLENTVGEPHSQLISAYVNASHPLDPINHAINQHLGFTIDGQHYGLDLDDLIFVLHAPINPTIKAPQEGGLQASVMDEAHAASRAVDAALQRANFTTHYQHATGMSYSKIVKAFGGDETAFHEHLGIKVKEAAARSWAEELYAKLPPPDRAALEVNENGKREFLRQMSAAVLREKEDTKNAVARLQHNSDEGEHYFYRYLLDEIGGTSRGHRRKWVSDGAKNYIDAVRLTREQILPHGEHLLSEKTLQNTWGEFAGAKVAEADPLLGNYGIQRLDGATVQSHTKMLDEFIAEGKQIEERLRGNKKSISMDELEGMRPEHFDRAAIQVALRERRSLFDKMADEAHALGYDSKQLGVFFDGTADGVAKMIGVLKDAKANLPREVLIGENAPPELHAAVGTLKGKGFRLVHGTDIGHHIRPDTPMLDPSLLGRALTNRKRLAEAIGVGTENFGPLDMSAVTRNRAAGALQQAVTDGRVVLPDWANVQTILNHLNSDAHASQSLPWAHDVMFTLARGAHRKNLKLIADEQFGGDVVQAEQRLKETMATVGGLRNMSVKLMTERLMTPLGNLVREDMRGLPWMTEKNAKAIAVAIKESYANTPVHMMGLQHYMDLLRFAPFRLGTKFGWDSKMAVRLMSLPDDLIRTRDNVRFTLSPMFSLRRIAKTNIKMAADGVPATVNPLGKLVADGEHTEAMRLLDTVLGHDGTHFKALDDAERFLHQNDIFGLYNPRHYEAYYAMARKKEGWSNEQIKEGIVRVFSYGTRGKEGRTAAERSLNLIFFPFSFEKTVVRNIGGYLMDHQAQALVLNNSLAAYSQFSQNAPNNPFAMQWIEKHLPLLQEIERLNAFAHGISLGQPGGINAPLIAAAPGGTALLNMFLPQSMEMKHESQRTRLERLAPIFGDLQRVVNETADTAYVFNTSFHNGMDRIEGHEHSPMYRRPSNIAPAVQLSSALEYRQQLIEDFKAILDHNAHVGDASGKYTFGWDKDLPDSVKGQPISRSTISQIVAQAFPAYDPNGGALFAIQRKQDAHAFINSYHGQAQYDQYRDFYAKADKVVGHLNRDDYPAQQAAQVQGLFRQQARALAETDPAFKTFYKRTFAAAFGPLELP